MREIFECIDENGNKYYGMQDSYTGINGLLIRKVLPQRFRTEAEVVVAYEEFIKKYSIAIEIKDYTIEEFSNKWLKMHSTYISQGTCELYKDRINKHIIPQLGRFKLKELTAGHVGEFYYLLKERGLSPDGVYKTHQILSRILERAVVFNLLDVNVCRRVEPPKLRVKRNDYWDLG